MKIFLATNPYFLHILEEVNQKYVLLSYLFLSKGNQDEVEDKLRELQDSGVEVIIDSGAHTLQKGGEVNYESFFSNYLIWLKRMQDYIYQYVELDIENIVGIEKVYEWTAKLEKELKQPPIKVWHRWRGVSLWEQMAKENDFIGFSGFLVNPGGGGEIPVNYIPLFLNIAKKYNCKVHGFGFTKPNLIMRFPFYSVDSTSWLMGGRYGNIYYFTGRKMTSRHRNVIAKNPSAEDLNNWNALQWKKFSDFMEMRT